MDKSENKNLEQNKKKKWFKSIGLKSNIILYIFLISIILCGFVIYDNFSTGGYKINYLLKKINRIILIKKVKLKNGKYIIVKSNYDYKKTNDEFKNLTNEEIEFKLKNEYVPTVQWKHIKTGDMNIPRRWPYLITLKNGNVLVFGDEYGIDGISKEITIPEIFNPNTKKYNLLDKLNYKLSNMFYTFNNGNILFIDNNHCTLFDINTNKFRKVSNGIGFYNKAQYCNRNYDLCNNYAFQIIPFSDNIIYILVLEKTGRYDEQPKYLKYILKFNLETYKFETREVKESPEISDIIVLNKGKILLVSQNMGNIYVYDALENKFDLKSRLIIYAKYYLEHLGNNKILFVPEKYYDNIRFTYGSAWELPPFQVLDLRNFNVSVIKTFAQYYKDKDGHGDENNWAISNDYIVFIDGRLFNKYSQKCYIPYDFNKYYYNNNIWDFYNGSIAKLNDDEFLRVGRKIIPSSTTESEIIKLEKLNKNLYVKQIHDNKTYKRILKEIKAGRYVVSIWHSEN